MYAYLRGSGRKASCLQSQGADPSLAGAGASEMRIVECGMWIEKIKFRIPQSEFQNVRLMLAAQSGFRSEPLPCFHKMSDQANLEMILKN